MEINTTVIVALIAAISAIIAPVITAFINNRYQLKIRKIELYEQKRIDVINSYSKSLNAYLNNICGNTEYEFAQHKQAIFLYAPKSTWKIIEKINKNIDERKFDDARNLLPDLMKELSPSIFGGKHIRK